MIFVNQSMIKFSKFEMDCEQSSQVYDKAPKQWDDFFGDTIFFNTG